MNSDPPADRDETSAQTTESSFWIIRARSGCSRSGAVCETEQTIPPVLIVAATGPGRLLVSAGAVTLAELRNGTLSDREMDGFTSQWMQQRLADVSAVQRAAHVRVREKVDERWADVDPTFGAVLAGHMLRRMLATIRSAQHGGMLIVVPGRRVAELLSDGRYVRVKSSTASPMRSPAAGS